MKHYLLKRRYKECYDQSNRERIIKEIEKELEGSDYIRISTETYKDNKTSTTHILECLRGHEVKIYHSHQYRETYCDVCKVIERLEDVKT